MLMATVAIVILVAATAVYAMNKTCTSYPCRGTNKDDVLFERTGNKVRDAIFGLKKADRINAGTWGRDADNLYGGPGNDTLTAGDNDGKDTLNGGGGVDTCNGDSGDVPTSCEKGNLS